MKIFYPAAYFYPENTAFSHLETDLLQTLTAAGHTIEVYCPIPTRGCSAEAKKKYASLREETLYNGTVHVHRYWAPQEGRNPFIRAFRYFWCLLRECQLCKKSNADVMLTSSTPPLHLLLLRWMKKKRPEMKIVYNLQDIFPDSLVNTGLSHRGSLLWKLGRRMEDAGYRACDKIIVISEDFRRNLLGKSVPEGKMEVIYNWVDTVAVFPVAKEDNRLFEEFSLNRDDFLAIYAGNLGEMQNGSCLLEAARQLREHPEIQLIIFGGGSEYEPLQAQAAQQKIENVRFFPLLPVERVSEVYSAADVALISCKAGTGNAGMPSKTWSIMATGTPIVASFDRDSELAQIIARADCGRVVDANRPDKIADAIMEAATDRTHLNEQGQNGRAYAMAHHGKDAATGAYLRVMENALSLKKI